MRADSGIRQPDSAAPVADVCSETNVAHTRTRRWAGEMKVLLEENVENFAPVIDLLR
ncbi:hypothetical protein [Nocardia australiensis]|uniref:hypothetical protein n=1 Tax=Nocardia australiensis TaxID=2887191 RepID=UPI001D15218C|nr:hypothetical protein [Nocardia australiensis]